MKAWTKFSLSLSRQLTKHLPQTAGRIRRWKDDVLLPKLKPVKEKIEFPQARKNFQRDFEKAAAPTKAPNSAPYEAAKQRLDKRKAQTESKVTSSKRQQNDSASKNAVNNKAAVNKSAPKSTQKQVINQPNTISSAKQEFAKAKASGRVAQDFNLVVKPQQTHGISK